MKETPKISKVKGICEDCKKMGIMYQYTQPLSGIVKQSCSEHTPIGVKIHLGYNSNKKLNKKMNSLPNLDNIKKMDKWEQ